MMCDRRLASAFLILATGISAVILVEKLQSYSFAPLATYAPWFIATPRAASPMVTAMATATMTRVNRFPAPFEDQRWLLPYSEVCR